MVARGTSCATGRRSTQRRVDLKVPAEWGGIADPENLQPLCEDCLKGKRQYQETCASYSEQIRNAADSDGTQ